MNVIVVIPAFARDWRNGPPAVFEVVIKFVTGVAGFINNTISGPDKIRGWSRTGGGSPGCGQPAARDVRGWTWGGLSEGGVVLARFVREVINSVLNGADSFFINEGFIRRPARIAPPRAFVEVIKVKDDVEVFVVGAVWACPYSHAPLADRNPTRGRGMFWPFKDLGAPVKGRAVRARNGSWAPNGPVGGRYRSRDAPTGVTERRNWGDRWISGDRMSRDRPISKGFFKDHGDR